MLIGVIALVLLAFAGAVYLTTAKNTTLPEGALRMLNQGELPESIWVPEGPEAQSQQITFLQAAKRLRKPMKFRPVRIPGKGVLLTPHPL